MDTTNEDSSIIIEATFDDIGENILVSDPESAFFRPFKKLVESSGKGKIKSVTPILLLQRIKQVSGSENSTEFHPLQEIITPRLYVHRLFGCLAVSGDSMLSFYPATSFPQREMGRVDGRSEDFKVIQERNWFKIDHFTLQNNLKEWHITGKDAKGKPSRFRNGTVEKLNDDLYHWFSMGVRRFRDFELLPRKYTLTKKVPEVDKVRRQEIINNSLQSNIVPGENLLNLADGRQTSQNFSLLHFEFFIAKGDNFTASELLISPVARYVHSPKVKNRRDFHPPDYDYTVIITCSLTSSDEELPQNVILTRRHW